MLIYYRIESYVFVNVTVKSSLKLIYYRIERIQTPRE
ncbi:hypothetical protein J5U23_01728 [Saccharolobus shibatae B12]|uniref:Uncharacterized protein n=1 Tax=Saccharolobus shibatae (strain ATCC 51178 / DSM 5389 / JCM 8931 / NBRC 15437 / B12) TaxID=523848 RepID=A0A8F5GTE0_SACSH|nr:hypothetical protein J5U23_01728 [Saccharolobus shibatae B12]